MKSAAPVLFLLVGVALSACRSARDPVQEVLLSQGRLVHLDTRGFVRHIGDDHSLVIRLRCIRSKDYADSASVWKDYLRMTGAETNWWTSLGDVDPYAWWCFTAVPDGTSMSDEQPRMFTANIPCTSLPCRVERFLPSPLGNRAIIVLADGSLFVVNPAQANEFLDQTNQRLAVLRPSGW